MQSYFNEFDPHAAEWLRELMRDGRLGAGEVDERSIKDVASDDLRRFGACHFFAGIGGWPLALSLAGWPASQPVWTGSCPCQPYSSAGKRLGNADERNLWPDFFRLIRECRPECVFGEQVEGAIRHGWLDRVCADLEGEGYTVGSVVLGAHSAGAPHIRQRLFWVAHSRSGERDGRGAVAGADAHGLGDHASGASGASELADAVRERAGRDAGTTGDSQRKQPEPRNLSWQQVRIGFESRGSARGVTQCDTASNGRVEGGGHGNALHGPPLREWEPEPGGTGSVGVGLGHAESAGAGPEEQRGRLHGPERSGSVGVTLGDANGTGSQVEQAPGPGEGRAVGRTGPLGFWSDFDLLPCRDGKARRVEPGTFPLAHGVPGRVGLLRGYGNAICVPTAAAFVKAFLEAEAEGCVK